MSSNRSKQKKSNQPQLVQFVSACGVILLVSVCQNAFLATMDHHSHRSIFSIFREQRYKTNSGTTVKRWYQSLFNCNLQSLYKTNSGTTVSPFQYLHCVLLKGCLKTELERKDVNKALKICCINEKRKNKIIQQNI